MINDKLYVTLHQELWGQQIQNKLAFRVNVLFTDQKKTLAEAFDAFITSHWAPTVTGDLKFKLVRVTDASGVDDTVYEQVPTTIQGTNAGSQTMPSTVAGIISIRSNTTSKRKNGRIYVGGLVQRAPQLDGRINTMNLAELASLGAGLLGVFSGMPTLDDFTFGVYSPARTAPPAATPRDAMFTAAEAVRIQPIWGTQRSRRIGVGA